MKLVTGIIINVYNVYEDRKCIILVCSMWIKDDGLSVMLTYHRKKWRAIMRKLKICKAIAVTLVAGMIITGYKGNIVKRHYEMAYAGNGSFNSEVSSAVDIESNTDNKNADEDKDKDFLIITWDEESEVVDRLADIMDADIYKPQVSGSYIKVYDDIDMSEYSTYFVNLSSESKNSVNVLGQLADEGYLDEKTIIPIYDTDNSSFELISELEERTDNSVWLTGSILDYSASDDEIKSWIKGLGLFFVSDAECSDEAAKCVEKIENTGCVENIKNTDSIEQKDCSARSCAGR